MRADGLAALDNRSREIFRRIVESYLDDRRARSARAT